MRKWLDFFVNTNQISISKKAELSHINDRIGHGVDQEERVIYACYQTITTHNHTTSTGGCSSATPTSMVIVLYRTFMEMIDCSTKTTKWKKFHFLSRGVSSEEQVDSVNEQHQHNGIHHVCASVVSLGGDIGDCVVTGDSDGLLRAYSVKNGELVTIFGSSSSSLSSLSSSFTVGSSTGNGDNLMSDSNITATTPASTTTTITPTTSNSSDHQVEQQSIYSHKSAVNVIFVLSSDYLISGGEDGTARLWSLKDGQIERMYFDVNFLSPVTAIAYHDIPRVIVLGYANGFVKRYERDTGRVIVQMGNRYSKQIAAMSVLDYTGFLIFSNVGDVTRIWDLSAEVEHTKLSFCASCMAYDSHNDVLFVGNSNGELILYKAVITDETAGLDDRRMVEIKKSKAHMHEITSIAYYHEEDVLVTTSNKDQSIVVWKSVVQNAINSLDTKTKKIIISDMDYRTQHLNPKDLQAVIKELHNFNYVESADFVLTEVEKTNFALVLSVFNDELNNQSKLQIMGETFSAIHDVYSSLNSRVEEVENELKMGIEQHRQTLTDTRINIIRQHEEFFEFDNKSLSNEIEAAYKKEISLIPVADKSALLMARQQYKLKRLQYEKDKRIHTQTAAKQYQEAKQEYLCNLQQLDSDFQKKFREVVTSINVCGDCNSDEYYPLEGQYKLLYPINTGTSRVFVAIDLQQHRLVAIKVLPAGIAIADNLIHNTIVPIYEIIASDTHTFVIMKRMDINLNKLIKAQPNMFTHNPDGVAHFIRRLVQSIQYLHSKQVVHRDIRPENILLDSTSPTEPMLTHFGLMKAATGNERSDDGAYFSAPELFVRSIFLESDVWSIGCLTLYMLQSPEARLSQPLISMGDTRTILSTMMQLSCPSESDIQIFCRACVKDMKQREWIQEIHKETFSTSTNNALKQDLTLSQLPSDVSDFVTACLQFLPSKRPRLEQLSQMPFLLRGTDTSRCQS